VKYDALAESKKSNAERGEVDFNEFFSLLGVGYYFFN
jgi:hypothetical protein